MYLFRVSHPVHGEIEVEASGRYFAVTKAACEWGLRWSTIARDCRVEELAPVKERIATSPSAPRNDRKDSRNRRRNEKGGGRDAKADKKKQRPH